MRIFSELADFAPDPACTAAPGAPASLHLPLTGPAVLVLQAAPLGPPLGPSAAQVDVAADGRHLATLGLEQPTQFGVALPEDSSHVTVSASAAIAIARVRLVGIAEAAARAAAPAAEPASIVEVMHALQSLGDNCEFGIAQRHCELEPLGLLRFTASPIDRLIAALEARFAGIDDPANLVLEVHGDRREYVLLQTRYGMRTHTLVLEHEMTADRVLAQQRRKLQFLARKLIEDLEGGRKLFVYKRNAGLAEAEVLALHAAMRRYGRPALLWVAQADAAHPAGSAAVVGDGLLRGFIAGFAPYETALQATAEPWLALASRAFHLWRSEAPVGSMLA